MENHQTKQDRNYWNLNKKFRKNHARAGQRNVNAEYLERQNVGSLTFFVSYL